MAFNYVFACSLIHNGVLGGSISILPDCVIYRTGKLTVEDKYKNLVIPYENIEDVIWMDSIVPIATFVMRDKSLYKFMIFNKKRFVKIYDEMTTRKIISDEIYSVNTYNFPDETESEYTEVKIMNKKYTEEIYPHGDDIPAPVIKTKKGEIRLLRDSVSMGDDCNAPNESIADYFENEKLSVLIAELTGYVPAMRNVVWSVIGDNGILGYLYSDDSGKYKFELAVEDEELTKLRLTEVYCRYYYGGKLSLKDTEKCETLLDTVKMYESKK